MSEKMDDRTYEGWFDAVMKDSDSIKPDLVLTSELEQAKIDPVMHIPNRHSMEERLAQLEREGKGDIGIIIVDGNNFGAVNDQCGHAVGDGYLRRLALLLEFHLDLEASELYRYGGDEVLIILQNMHSKKDLNKIGLRLAHAFTGGGEIGGEDPVIPTISMGGEWVSSQAEKKESIHDAVERADSAMFYAKRNYADHLQPVELKVRNQPSISQPPSVYLPYTDRLVQE